MIPCPHSWLSWLANSSEIGTVSYPLSYRTAVHESTGCTSAVLMLGQKLWTVKLVFGIPTWTRDTRGSKYGVFAEAVRQTTRSLWGSQESGLLQPNISGHTMSTVLIETLLLGIEFGFIALKGRKAVHQRFVVTGAAHVRSSWAEISDNVTLCTGSGCQYTLNVLMHASRAHNLL